MDLPDTFDPQYITNLYESVVLREFPNMPKVLKVEQADSIYQLLKGRDLLLILPTGFGKSLVYVVPGIVKAKLAGSGTKTVIVAPLTSLINNAIRKLNSYNLKAFHIRTVDDILNAAQASANEAIYLFVSPEFLIKLKTKRQMMDIRPDYLIVDEGHISSEWSNGFRNDFGCIYEIRACVDCPFAVLTATLTDELINDVKAKTGLKSSLCTIALRPDRSNIFLDFRPGANKDQFKKQLANEIREQGIIMNKTIVFVTSKTKASEMFSDFKTIIGDDANYSVAGKRVGRLVNFYHADTEETTKESIELAFEKPNGVLRCLICTVAFGLGVDIANIRRVFIYGTLTTPMMLWQEIGRVGRDGEQSEAILLPFHSNGPFGTQKWTPDTSGCFRKYMMNFFYGRQSISTYDLEGKVTCCTFCRSAATFNENESNKSISAMPSKLKQLLKSGASTSQNTN